MNAIHLLPYILPFMALGIAAMLVFTRWLECMSHATHQRRMAHRWHMDVVRQERASGHHVHDGSITDIKPMTFM